MQVISRRDLCGTFDIRNRRERGFALHERRAAVSQAWPPCRGRGQISAHTTNIFPCTATLFPHLYSAVHCFFRGRVFLQVGARNRGRRGVSLAALDDGGPGVRRGSRQQGRGQPRGLPLRRPLPPYARRGALRLRSRRYGRGPRCLAVDVAALTLNQSLALGCGLVLWWRWRCGGGAVGGGGGAVLAVCLGVHSVVLTRGHLRLVCHHLVDSRTKTLLEVSCFSSISIIRRQYVGRW